MSMFFRNNLRLSCSAQPADDQRQVAFFRGSVSWLARSILAEILEAVNRILVHYRHEAGHNERMSDDGGASFVRDALSHAALMDASP